MSNAERYTLAAYHLFVLLSTLIGDSLILFASFKKGAFKLHPFIVTVIQHIAVSDLSYALLSVLPRAVSLLTESWVLGDSDALCYATVYFVYFNYAAGLFLIAALTTSKFMLLKYPFRCSTWTKKLAIGVCCISLTPPLIFPILFSVVDKADIVFDSAIYTCIYGFIVSRISI